MAVDFVALDWETANGARGSACAVGLVRVEAGAVVDTWSTLLRPPECFSGFDENNTAVHGLRAADVADAPRFIDVWPTIESWLRSSTVVAHNAPFDLGVVQDATWAAGACCPRLRVGCTLALARRHYDLPSYTLDVVAEAAGVSLAQHHEALADSLAAAEILMRIAEESAASSVDEVFDLHGLALGWSTGPDAAPCRVVGRSRWTKVVPGTAGWAESTLW